jgi:hypothetical protein
MVVPSGIVLPGDEPLPVREVVSGLYVVEQTYERDLGYFSESPIYAKGLASPGGKDKHTRRQGDSETGSGW